MNLISYRGPGQSGGVSAALMRLFDTTEAHHNWWYMDGEQIMRYVQAPIGPNQSGSIPKQVVEGHYRHCNEFIWPIMHELPAYATYRLTDHFLYNRFNQLFASKILENHCQAPFFIQDYQLGLLAQCLTETTSLMAIFWHIPWPKNIPQQFLPPIMDLAKSLLAAHVIGFHTKEYAHNFLAFVNEFLPNASCQLESAALAPASLKLANRQESCRSRQYPHAIEQAINTCQTTIVVAPLGLDCEYWSAIANNKVSLHSSFMRQPFVLSVDRADYTKGVLNRLQAIELFFDTHPDLKGKVTFAQICGRTRAGLPAYDQYWQDCQRQLAMINDKLRSDGWTPILSMQGPLYPSELAILYRHAAVMLVNPLRDGLNLTAKEFVACQQAHPGALVLSPYAGAWDELGRDAVAINPYCNKDIADATYEALQMSETERSLRVRNMSKQLQYNSLRHWCDRFTNLLGDDMAINDPRGLRTAS